MSALEDEIVEKFRLLDKDAQRRVLETIQVDFNRAQPFDHADWSARVDALKAEIKARRGDEGPAALDLLWELREEESEWPSL
jgi:hypothetical protein